MRVAVLSDIHANYYAFRACYEDAVKQRVDSFIFLGDYVSDLAEPEKTMDLLYTIRETYPTHCLRGNRERYMLDCAAGKTQFTRGSQSGSLLFTFDHLRREDIAFFRSLKSSDTIELCGVKMEIAHAGFTDDRLYFESSDSVIRNVFSEMKSRFLLTGHSHKQYIKTSGGKTIFNPGSVGIPQDGTRWPKYGILDIQKGEISCILREVPYDLTDAIHAQFARGLTEYAPYWAIGILYDIIRGEECVLRVLEQVRKTNSLQDEAAWRRAAEELGMKFTEDEIKELLLCV